MAGSQDYAPDPRNDHILVWLNGELVQRREAKVSIFDAGFALGDGIWEGLRLHKGALLFLEAHLDRLYRGAEAIRLDIGRDRAQLVRAIAETLAANAMTDGVHIRLMVTRGLKATVNQDPRNALGTPTLAIVAEHKAPPAMRPLRLASVSVRCTPASMFDMRLNSHSRLNLIRALIEAIEAGADEALMLDPQSFVSSCNATNLFFATAGRVFTSTGAYCFNGVTRANVIGLCRDHGVEIAERDFGLEEALGADEAFATGTLGGIAPVGALDGHVFPAAPGPVTSRLAGLYEALKDVDAAAHPLP
jgi:branched-chain amino acid aminotransferase